MFLTKNSNDSWIKVCQHCWINNTAESIKSFTQLVDGHCVVCDHKFYIHS
jgi:hypothetical protein